MSSTIKCVSCKQRINLAPDASGIVICPMCKTQQPVPDDQGQNAPNLRPEPVTPQASSPPVQSETGFGPIDRSASNQYSPPQGQQDFDPPKGGCGCLLAGVLIAVAVVPMSLFVFALV